MYHCCTCGVEVQQSVTKIGPNARYKLQKKWKCKTQSECQGMKNTESCTYFNRERERETWREKLSMTIYQGNKWGQQF